MLKLDHGIIIIVYLPFDSNLVSWTDVQYVMLYNIMIGAVYNAQKL